MGALLAERAALVVLDGVTEALSTMGRSTLDNDEVTGWVRQVPRRIAQATGAAVALVDHVTKSTEGRGRWAIGAQAKLAALDGAAYGVEIVQPLGRGLRGELRLWIGKDREGAVRPVCGRFHPNDRTQLAAVVVVDATAGPITVTVQAPEEVIGSEVRPFRPTGFMERLSRALEASPEPLSTNALVGLVTGRKEHKAQALQALVAEGYVKRTPGSNSSHLHQLARPYREADDPSQDHGSTAALPGSATVPPNPAGEWVPGSLPRGRDPGPTQNASASGSGTHPGPTGTHRDPAPPAASP